MINANKIYLSARSKITSHRVILANYGYLFILQVLNVAFPLVTLPYLISVLGAESYGKVIYSQAVIGYLAIVINFGFNIIGTREISVHRNSQAKINEITSCIYIIKGLLFLISLIGLLVFLNLNKYNVTDQALFLLTMYLCLNEFLFPIWFFQGMEKMKFITFLTLLSRVIFTLLTFLLVKSDRDILLVPGLNAIGILVSCSFSLIILYRQNVRIKLQNFRTLTHYAKLSYVMGIAYAANALKTNLNLILVKFLLSYKDVAFFDLAIKINNLGVIFLDLVSQTVFPKMSREKNTDFLKKIIALSITISLGLVLIISVCAPLLVTLLGSSAMSQSVPLLRVLVVSLPFYIWGALLGRNCLIVNGQDSELLKSMEYSSVLYLALVSSFVIIKVNSLMIYMSLSYVVSFAFESFYRFRMCKLKHLI